jgi:four helix bundle protein
VPLNIAEGTDQREARRTSHYSIALRSAREAWSALRTGSARGYVAEPPAEVRAQFDHLIGALHALSHPR